MPMVFNTLWVDLSEGRIWQEEVDPATLRRFLGGYGLGAKLILDHMKKGAEPLGPENVFGIVTGPLTGTPAVGGSRFTVVGKSPLTLGWGDANSGGNFGPRMRRTGFDALFVKGVAEEPVYLLVLEKGVEIRSAADLWGLDTYNTEKVLKDRYGWDCGVVCIGPSGERQALISAVMNNKGRAAARSGLGAVMGSKKLKAVVVKGTRDVYVSDRTGAEEIRRKCAKGLTGHVEMLRQYGTPAIFVRLVQVGDAPIKNWTGVPEDDFPNPEKIGAEAVVAKQRKRFACYRCPIACGGRMKPPEGKYVYASEAHKPEYETLAMLGSNCLNEDLDSIILMNDICNRYGLDTISTGACVAMAIECFENGILSLKDTDGLELRWGNPDAMVKLVEKIAKREGIGDVFADGVMRAAERIGRGAEGFAMHVGGQEVPAHNPRYGFHWALSYRMDATPARHTQGPGMPVAGLPIPEWDRSSQTGMQPGYKLGMCITHVVNSLGMCLFVWWAYPHADLLIETVRAVTGWDVDYQELFDTGERIANIRHIFNLREGISPHKFRFPDRIAGRPPQSKGPLKGITIVEEVMDKEFFEAMNWDPKTTVPSRNRLEQLNLTDAIKFLE
ncbi:MAG: aldehyde ferredoxin oxidoreductase family protein [Candidatus Bathyarchaeia archaeon]